MSIYRKVASYHKISWIRRELFSITNASNSGLLSPNDNISSFLVDDVNNDDLNDIIISVDVIGDDGVEKTVVIKAENIGGDTFNLEKIDPEASGGKFILIDTL